MGNLQDLECMIRKLFSNVSCVDKGCKWFCKRNTWMKNISFFLLNEWFCKLNPTLAISFYTTSTMSWVQNPTLSLSLARSLTHTTKMTKMRLVYKAQQKLQKCLASLQCFPISSHVLPICHIFLSCKSQTFLCHCQYSFWAITLHTKHYLLHVIQILC